MKKITKYFLIITFIAICLCGYFFIILPVFISEHKPFVVSSNSLQTITLQLKWKHQFQFAGYYAAKALGYYQKAGLDVQIKEAESHIDPAQVVLQGKAEFGISNSELLILKAHGDPVVALASIYQHSPLVWLVTKKSGLDNIHSLEGKRVMLEPHATELVAYLNEEGVDMKKMVQVPHTFDPLSLMLGEVDAMSAYSTDEPFFLEQYNIDYLMFNPRASGIDFYGDTLFTTEQEVKNHPQRVKAFVEASLQGWDYALQHPDEMIDLIYKNYSHRHSREHLAFEAKMTRNLIMADVVGINLRRKLPYGADPSLQGFQPIYQSILFRLTLVAIMADVVELGYMNPGRWRYISEIYQSLGMISKNFSLQGFLYNQNQFKNSRWLYLSLIISLLFSGLISLILFRFYQFQVALQKEINEKIERDKQINALEQKYKILVENSPFSVIISSLDGKILYINPRGVQQFDISQSYALNLNTKDFYSSPEDRSNLLKILKQKGFVHDMDYGSEVS